MRKSEKLVFDDAIADAINSRKKIIIQRYVIGLLIVVIVAIVAGRFL